MSYEEKVIPLERIVINDTSNDKKEQNDISDPYENTSFKIFKAEISQNGESVVTLSESIDEEKNIVEKHERLHGTGNGIIKFLDEDELIVLRRNDFRKISSIDQGTNTDYPYPPPMHKLAKKDTISEEIVECRLKNCVIDHYLFSISCRKSNKIEAYNLKTGELDKLFNIINDKYAYHEDSKFEYNNPKIKRYESLPVFA
ncbi:6_t:CDS:2, partial [Ambispora gerdemannii]